MEIHQSAHPQPPTLFFVRRMVAYRPWSYAVVALAWILFHSWPLLPGLVAKVFFDMLEGRAAAGWNLVTVTALVAASGLARVGVTGFATLVGREWGFSIRALVRRNLVAAVLRQPGARALPGSVGDALSTIRDDTEDMTIMTDWFFDALAGLIFAVGGIAILLSVNARIAVLVFVPVVVVVVLAQAARARLEHTRTRSRLASANVAGSIGDIFGAVQALQLANAQERVLAHLAELGEHRQRMVLRDRLQSLGLDAVFNNVAALGSGLTLLLAATQMRAGTFTVGDFALFSTYLMQVADYTGFLGYLVATYRQSAVAFRRGLRLLQDAPAGALVEHHALHLRDDLPPLAPPPPNTAPPFERLVVRDLHVRFPGDERGVEDISFEVRRGSFTVITGRVGAGKTTLVRAVLGLLPVERGEVWWNDAPVHDLASFMQPPRVAYTPQVPTLLSGTVRDNILLGWPAGDDALADAIENAALGRDIAGWARGIGSEIGTRGMKLSGGQVQRTAAARMWVRDAELLVLDDISSALDIDTERQLWERVWRSGRTALVVGHRRALLERADQIIVLEHGCVTAQGTLRDLLPRSAELRRLLGEEEYVSIVRRNQERLEQP